MPLTKWQPPVLREEIRDKGQVTWLELFFDLVYVAALIQLGDRLATDLSWRGVIAFIGAFVLLWWTWTGTTGFMNQFAVDDVTHRVLAFVQMGGVGNLAVIAASRPESWRVWLVFAYLAARLPLLLMWLRVMRTIPRSRPIGQRYVRFTLASVSLWIISLAVPGDLRFAVWAVALAVEFISPLRVMRDGSGLPLHDHHFQERYALFTIIVLGETFVKSLSLVTDQGLSLESQVFGGIGFVMLIALWWTYFDDVADAHIRSTSALAATPGTNRLLWVYLHLPLAAALTAFGVAAKKVIDLDTFDKPFKTTSMWLLLGALIVVLLAVALLDLVTASPHYAVDAPERVGPRVAAAIALVGLGLLAMAVDIKAVTLIAITAAVVVAQIAIEVLIAKRSDHRIDAQVRSDLEAASDGCEHLDAAVAGDRPAHPRCEACDALKQHPVQLRWCLECGHVGCCDDTPGQHARQHFDESGHALIATLEPGDDWAYCYLDDASRPGFLESAAGE